jgi:hypothetical protein
MKHRVATTGPPIGDYVGSNAVPQRRSIVSTHSHMADDERPDHDRVIYRLRHQAAAWFHNGSARRRYPGCDEAVADR